MPAPGRLAEAVVAAPVSLPGVAPDQGELLGHLPHERPRPAAPTSCLAIQVEAPPSSFSNTPCCDQH